MPVRPYQWTWSERSGPGVGDLNFRGAPDTNSGRIGGIVSAYGGGAGSFVTSVGANYVPDRSGTLLITILANVWGIGSAVSFLFGYASAYSALRAYVERLDPAVVYIAQSSNIIYQHAGPLVFDYTRIEGPTAYVDRSVSLTIPVRGGATYRIWADAVQYATGIGFGEGTSNFAMYVTSMITNLL